MKVVDQTYTPYKIALDIINDSDNLLSVLSDDVYELPYTVGIDLTAKNIDITYQNHFNSGFVIATARLPKYLEGYDTAEQMVYLKNKLLDSLTRYSKTILKGVSDIPISRIIAMIQTDKISVYDLVDYNIDKIIKKYGNKTIGINGINIFSDDYMKTGTWPVRWITSSDDTMTDYNIDKYIDIISEADFKSKMKFFSQLEFFAIDFPSITRKKLNKLILSLSPDEQQDFLHLHSENLLPENAVAFSFRLRDWNSFGCEHIYDCADLTDGHITRHMLAYLLEQQIPHNFPARKNAISNNMEFLIENNKSISMDTKDNRRDNELFDMLMNGESESLIYIE